MINKKLRCQHCWEVVYLDPTYYFYTDGRQFEVDFFNPECYRCSNLHEKHKKETLTFMRLYRKQLKRKQSRNKNIIIRNRGIYIRRHYKIENGIERTGRREEHGHFDWIQYLPDRYTIIIELYCNRCHNSFIIHPSEILTLPKDFGCPKCHNIIDDDKEQEILKDIRSNGALIFNYWYINKDTNWFNIKTARVYRSKNGEKRKLIINEHKGTYKSIKDNLYYNFKKIQAHKYKIKLEKNKRVFYSKLRKLTKSTGLTCTNKESFINYYSYKLNWICKEGHLFQQTPLHVLKEKEKSCKQCYPGIWKNEQDCREILEDLFQKPFPNSRPKWLLNHKGNTMQLDGYNEELNIAFEYQGKQHYDIIPFFHDKGRSLYEQQQVDKLKEHLCDMAGINLIIIPYWVEDKVDHIIKSII